MKIKSYLFSLFSITLLSLGTWLLILFNVDPTTHDFITISAFFGCLFLWLMGLLTFIIFYLRIWLTNNEVIYSYLPVSIRHSVLIPLTVVGLIVMKSLTVLTWWDSAMFIVVVIMLELFFRTKKTN